uniref:peptidylprolyl isomerase n=1 Tax=Spongospora subterranea TaxID=70186 RepID=A0A0H5R2P8_9EUKA|eukprot:CRZ02169.1 hypothetical protein [Spongospora subterranea]
MDLRNLADHRSVEPRADVKKLSVESQPSLFYRDLRPWVHPDENSQYPRSNDVVTCHYSGVLKRDGKAQTFDSSYERKTPTEFPVNGVIRGWTEVLQKMRVGQKWEVHIPYQLAYGENGFEPKIPAKTDLFFVIELIGINVKGTRRSEL